MSKSKPSSVDPQFLSRTHAAELLDVSPQLIDKFVLLGRLRAFRLGRKVVVRKDELLRLVEAGEV
jgi:excisionase family DNA binding protein